MAATSYSQESVQAGLEGWHARRRLMIRCPVTGLPADTGFDPTGSRMDGHSPRLLVDCQECGQDHEWRLEGAFVQ